MSVTNKASGTNVHEIVDEEPLLFHTGPRKMFPLVREAAASIIPLDKLAEAEPTTLACMHGSSWRGNGAKLLRSLADEVSR